jgi:hypothetical protein
MVSGCEEDKVVYRTMSWSCFENSIGNGVEGLIEDRIGDHIESDGG